MLFLLFVVLVVVVILYYRGKAKYQEAHPRNCARCNNLIPTGIELADGVMCEDCGKFIYLGKEESINHLRVHKSIKHVTCAEAKLFLDSVAGKELQEKSFTVTSQSPSGDILVDENQGLIKVKDNFVHKISDIKEITLVYEFTPGSGDDAGSYTGGHVEIKYGELYMTDEVRKHVDKKLFDVATKHEVRKVYEEEIDFLEKLTGLKHKTNQFG